MINWRELTNESQLDEIVELSHSHPVGIFKHSTRCGISSMAMRGFERSWSLSDTDFPLYYLDLIAYRPISNLIAQRFGVQHQSPQLIVLKNGEVAYHESHHSISADLGHLV